MYLTSLKVEGMRHGPTLSTPASLAVLPPGTSGVALADSLALFVAALRPERWRHHLSPLGWVGPSTSATRQGETLEHIEGVVPSAALASLLPGQRSITVEASVHLDPILYRRLRGQAVRDPRVVNALAGDPVLHLKVGWLANRDHTLWSPDLLGARMASVAFPTQGKERPTWLGPLASEIASRILCLRSPASPRRLAQRLSGAALSPAPEDRARWLQAQRALQGPPFSLPTPAIVHGAMGPDIAFGEELTRARYLGRAARDALQLVEAALIQTPDLLVIDRPLTEAERGWLQACTQGDSATLEQVLAP